MASRTLIGGTAYTIVGGKTHLNGTNYTIQQGRTLINGTGYNIKFTPEIFAIMYNTGDLVFKQWNTGLDTGKTVLNEYGSSFINRNASYTYVPWYNYRTSITNISFRTSISSTSWTGWFCNTKITTLNTTNLNLNTV